MVIFIVQSVVKYSVTVHNVEITDTCIEEENAH